MFGGSVDGRSRECGAAGDVCPSAGVDAARCGRSADVNDRAAGGYLRNVIDWSKTFAVHTPPLEIILRGTILYLVLYTLLRALRKRESGTTSITDLLVIVLIADAAQNAMADNYDSVSDGLILVATIIGWAYLLDFLAYRFPTLARIIKPRPLPLVKNGQILRRNMRRELITEEELHSQLRQQGIDDLDQVKDVFMEPDGQFSVVTGEQHPNGHKEKQAF
jgi:uncharacterized membrane protein YcaP (DUF421 family)